MKKIFIAAAVFISSSTVGQDNSSDSIKDLRELVITATKYPIMQSLTGKVITVITKEELEQQKGRSLGEVLNTQAGLIVNGSSNVAGTDQDVYMRGASAGKTLILIDGVPVYDASGISGAFDLNFIAIDMVERVEILKGSQSTLYGSDAIAGIINIITKKGAGKKIEGNATVAAGSYGTNRVTAGLNGKIDKTQYAIQATRMGSKGFSTALDETGSGNFDKDGVEDNSLIADIRHAVTDKLTIRASGRYSRYKADTDAGAFADDADYTITSSNLMAGAGADYRYGKGVLHFNYSMNKNKREYLDDSASRAGFFYFGKGEYIGRSHFTELYSNISLGDKVELLAGADLRRHLTEQSYLFVSGFGPYETPPLGDSAKVNQLGIYSSLLLKGLSNFNMEIGGRYNHFNKYGDVFTYSVNPSYQFNQRVKLFANISSGFKAPSLYQVYSEYRNAGELKPERSVNLEGGIQYVKDKVQLRAVYFSRKIDDVIIFVNTATFPYGYYANGDIQKDRGVELEARAEFSGIRFSGNYTNIDGEVTTDNNGKDSSFFNLYRRPRQAINLNIGFDICKDWLVNMGVQSIGKRYEAVFASAPVEMPSYTVWNIYSQYQVAKKIRLFLDLKNITDEKYSEVRGYNSRRFNVMGGITVNW